MKCLTVKNPWADWIINGLQGRIKTTENRTWETTYRGRLYIHVSKTPDKSAIEGIIIEPEVIERWQVQQGCIIGSVELYAIDRDIKTHWDEAGLFHWRLRNPELLKKPIPARGSLGLWDFHIKQEQTHD